MKKEKDYNFVFGLAKLVSLTWILLLLLIPIWLIKLLIFSILNLGG